MRFLARFVILLALTAAIAHAQELFAHQKSWLDDNLDADSALAMLESDSLAPQAPPAHASSFERDHSHLPHEEQIIAAHTDMPPSRELSDAAFVETGAKWVNPREHRLGHGLSMRNRARRDRHHRRHGARTPAEERAHRQRLARYASHYAHTTGQVSPQVLMALQQQAAEDARRPHLTEIQQHIMAELEAEKRSQNPVDDAAHMFEEDNKPHPSHAVNPFAGHLNARAHKPSPVLTLSLMHGGSSKPAPARAPHNAVEAAEQSFIETSSAPRSHNFHPRAPAFNDLPRFSPMQLSGFPMERHHSLLQTQQKARYGPSFAAPPAPEHAALAPKPAARTPPVVEKQEPALVETETEQTAETEQEQSTEVEAEQQTETSTEAEAEQQTEAETETEAEAEAPDSSDPKISLSELTQAIHDVVSAYQPAPMPMQMPVAYPFTSMMAPIPFGQNPLLAVIDKLKQKHAPAEEAEAENEQSNENEQQE